MYINMYKKEAPRTFCTCVGVYVNFHAAWTVETFSAVGTLVLLAPAFALEGGAGDV